MMFALNHRRRDTRGFTLIELMITVAIVAILAAIAVPSYRYAVLKGKRAQGRAAIIEVMQQQERYMTQNNQYSLIDSTSTIFKTFSGDNNSSNAYVITAVKCSATTDLNECVKVLATPKPSGADPAGGVLSMTSTGIKSCTGEQPSVCWP